MAGRFVRLLLPLLARSVDVDEAVDRVLVRMTDPRLRPECAATHGAWSADDGLARRTSHPRGGTRAPTPKDPPAGIFAKC